MTGRNDGFAGSSSLGIILGVPFIGRQAAKADIPDYIPKIDLLNGT